MGILKRLFKVAEGQQTRENFNWIKITQLDQLDHMLETSKNRTQVIFKHSTRCGVSRGVLRQFEAKTVAKGADFYYLDLLEHREISNAIASKFSINHQSPQLIIIKDGKVKAHESHYAIMSLEIENLN